MDGGNTGTGPGDGARADPRDEPGAAELFLVRLWRQEGRPELGEWQGRVQHVLSGETHHFRGWTSLVAVLQTLLPGPQPGEPAEQPVGTARDGD